MKSRHAARTMLVLLAPVLLSGAAALIPAAHAGTRFKVLHTFTGGKDGAGPMASLIKDEAGNLYGTTKYGGKYRGGTVFKLTPDGTETVLHAFAVGTQGGFYPEAGLIQDKAGNLYGTTTQGGGGTVFKLAPDGTETVLHAFTGGNDGAYPAAGLIQDKEGNLYGTTVLGGGTGCYKGCGTVFKIAPGGAETVLYAFTGGSDGGYPYAGVIRDKAGNLYGTASGAYNFGAVFKLAPDGTLTVLHSFTGGNNDGARPGADLIRDKAGNLYGTTPLDGAGGYGTVFKLAPDGTETVLHSFTGGDGAYPQGGVIQDKAGNLYGTTAGGNFVNGCDHGCGTVFKLAPDGTLTVLYALPSHKHRGSLPYAGLIRGRNGQLYGTAYEGGTDCPANSDGCGTVFKLREVNQRRRDARIAGRGR